MSLRDWFTHTHTHTHHLRSARRRAHKYDQSQFASHVEILQTRRLLSGASVATTATIVAVAYCGTEKESVEATLIPPAPDSEPGSLGQAEFIFPVGNLPNGSKLSFVYSIDAVRADGLEVTFTGGFSIIVGKGSLPIIPPNVAVGGGISVPDLTSGTYFISLPNPFTQVSLGSQPGIYTLTNINSVFYGPVSPDPGLPPLLTMPQPLTAPKL